MCTNGIGFGEVAFVRWHFAKPVLYEVPTYLAQNSNRSDKQKNKNKKSDGKIRNTNRR